jgi:hypothetical protein
MDRCGSLLFHCLRRSGNTAGNTDPADPPAPDVVSGTVTYNGGPVSGAQVTAFLTDSNSIYAIDVFFAGMWFVDAWEKTK